ncbi:hypothetical protein F8M41_017412 [Gigaspora margarita]|uniref:Uncharacterized protein n=1 Tax=Gigaspora margarita TaxID=4874 RepID=A0A8H4EVU9_GIGMA|nr:hypothetical protein F8M41_017412 [Gigaspora margarita]
MAESRFYKVTNLSGENLTIFIDLIKADATVGTQGILQTYFIHGNDTSPTNTNVQTLRLLMSLLLPASSADSINALHVGFALFISLFLFVCLRI